MPRYVVLITHHRMARLAFPLLPHITLHPLKYLAILALVTQTPAEVWKVAEIFQDEIAVVGLEGVLLGVEADFLVS